MPDLWCDVDAAVTVPVNLLSLTDDTDFKSRETAVAYNAAGMDLVWNFYTTAGVQTQTAVTPTTGGDYDWSHVGDGMYKIEIPASGGASINNDTEGFGWFTGLATGVLPWRGPTIGFRAAGLNNLLIDTAYSTTRGLAGTALPDAAAEAAGGLYTRGTGAGQLSQTANGELGVATLAKTLTTYTGNTPQTGDAYAIVNSGTHGNAALKVLIDAVDDFIDTEIAAILAAVDTEIAAIFDRIGAPAGASIAADLVVIDDFVDALESRLTAALSAKLIAHAAGVLTFTVDAGSTTTAVVLKTVEGTTPSATNDFYNGAVLVFTSGALAGQRTSITDYDGATKTCTVPALTGAPAEDVTGVIV